MFVNQSRTPQRIEQREIFVRCFFSQQLLAYFSHNSCSQSFLTTAVRWLFLTTAVRWFFSQQLFADFSQYSCSLIFLITAVRRFFSQQLFADFSHNSCSLIFLITAVRRFFSQQLFADGRSKADVLGALDGQPVDGVVVDHVGDAGEGPAARGEGHIRQNKRICLKRK